MLDNSFGLSGLNFFDKVNEFLVLNTGDSPMPIRYDGEEFNVPAGDKIDLPDPKAEHKRVSGKNSLGEWIPGSLIIRDIIGQRAVPADSIGKEDLRGNWDAEKCLKHCLNIPLKNTPKDAKPSGPLVERGLTILPLNPSPDLVARAREEARIKYDQFMSKWAEGIIFDYNVRAEKHKSLTGNSATAPGQDYYKALAYKQQAELVGRQRAQALGGVLPGDQVEEDEADLEDALIRIAAEKAVEKAGKGDEKLDRDLAAEILMKDPEFRAAVKKTHVLRKKRGPNKDKAQVAG